MRGSSQVLVQAQERGTWVRGLADTTGVGTPINIGMCSGAQVRPQGSHGETR